jgi:hypothetical protein
VAKAAYRAAIARADIVLASTEDLEIDGRSAAARAQPSGFW